MSKKQYKISQAEYWVRDYFIMAESKKEARIIYDRYLINGNMDKIDRVSDPDFLNDIQGDVEVTEHAS